MRLLLRRQPFDEGGATAIEYAMVAFFISIAAFSVLVSIGGSVTTMFQQVATSW